MKLLHIVRQFYPSKGGMEVYVAGLVSELASMGISLDILTLNQVFVSEQKLTSEDSFDAGGNKVPVKRVPFAGFQRMFFPDLSEVDFSEYDLIHIHGVDGFLYKIARMKKRGQINAPVLLTTHGGIFHTRFMWLFKHIWFKTKVARCLKYVDRIFACSLQDLHRFQDIASHTVLFENGVILKDLLDGNYSPGRDKLLYVGGFRENKRVPVLLNWFYSIARDYPSLKLSIVGTGEQQRQCEEFVHRHELSDRVTLCGRVSQSELKKLYLEADIFVTASAYEGFGQSVVEAMAAGCVIFAQELPPFQSFVIFGKNGILTDFDGEQARVDFQKLVSCPAWEWEKKKLESRKISARYDWRIKAREYLEVVKHYCCKTPEKQEKE
jgi:alpha-1,3-mannosyltransferase